MPSVSILSWLFMWLPPMRKHPCCQPSKLCSNFRRSLLFSQTRKSWDWFSITMTRIISLISSLFLVYLLIFSIIGHFWPWFSPSWQQCLGNTEAHIILNVTFHHPAPDERNFMPLSATLVLDGLENSGGAARLPGQPAPSKGTKAEWWDEPVHPLRNWSQESSEEK